MENLWCGCRMLQRVDDVLREGLIYSEFRSRASRISGMLRVRWQQNGINQTFLSKFLERTLSSAHASDEVFH